MSRYRIIDLPCKVEDSEWPYIIFVTKLICKHQKYTGYKELSEYGVDLDEFLEKTGFRATKAGSILITDSFLGKYNQHIYFDGKENERYYLDPDIFEYEYNLVKAFKDRNPVWFIPECEFNAYDEEMFNQLPETLQKWFIRKIHKGITTPAQELLKATYDKYVVKGVPLVSQFPTRERKCEQSKESDQ